MDELQAQSSKWKSDADKLLHDSQLVEQLKKFGKVSFSGSYAYDLMLNADIDMHLVIDNYSRGGAIAILTALIAQNWWNSFTYADWTQDKFRLPQWQWLPKAHYINLKADFAGSRWKVDLWILDKAKYKGDHLAPKMKKVTPEQKAVILLLKEARNAKQLTSGSYDIYTAVLDDDVKTVDEFKAWQAKCE